MRLIGMMDSPYVRRVAVSLALMRISFDHESVSVFRDYERFASINPVVKAPTLVTDEGVVLMDSTLILQHLHRLAPERSLLPGDRRQHARYDRITGLALAACEKTVQLVYEFERPAERRHGPWIDRVRQQLRAAYRLLDDMVPPEGWLCGTALTQADVAAAVALSFTRFILPDELVLSEHARLARLARDAEDLPAFKAWPMA
jgi:glutathione S-transferase